MDIYDKDGKLNQKDWADEELEWIQQALCDFLVKKVSTLRRPNKDDLWSILQQNPKWMVFHIGEGRTAANVHVRFTAFITEEAWKDKYKELQTQRWLINLNDDEMIRWLNTTTWPSLTKKSDAVRAKTNAKVSALKAEKKAAKEDKENIDVDFSDIAEAEIDEVEEMDVDMTE